jgi:Lar family restriction alleviation protein
MAELKPCPFCGGKARRKYGNYNLLGAYGTRAEDRQWHGVYCFNCGVSQPKKKYSTKEEAIEAWNRRAADGR